jgi:hypothetical protein
MVCATARVCDARPPRASRRPALGGVRFAYRLRPGDTFRYHVVAVFSGHIPPFAQPGAKPVHIRTDMVYAATVRKQVVNGAEVAISVEKADVSLLARDVGPEEKLDPDSVVPWPMPLSQVQGSLNVVAVIRPDGTVTSVRGGDAKLSAGFELRKLFLLLLPVTFPDRPVHSADSWRSGDGVLGHSPGRTRYTNRITGLRAAPNGFTLDVAQNAGSHILDTEDKNNKPTAIPGDVVTTTTGKATLVESLHFVARVGAAEGARAAGLLDSGHMTMTVNVVRKRSTPNPENPQEPLEVPIDVRASLVVKALHTPTGPVKHVARGARRG